MGRRRDLPPRPTRVMVLAGLLFFGSFLTFFRAVEALSMPPEEWPLGAVMRQTTFGGIVFLDGLLMLVIAFLLMANTLIGRWSAVAWGALTMVWGTAFLVAVITTYAPEPPPSGSKAVVFALSALLPGMLAIVLAYPTGEERRLRRGAATATDGT